MNHSAQRRGGSPRTSFIKFAEGIEMPMSDFRRACNGGMKRVLEAGTPQSVRDDIIANVQSSLFIYFANGNVLKAKLSSLVYVAAYRAAVNTYKKPSKYSQCRAAGDIVDSGLLETPGLTETHVEPEACAEKQMLSGERSKQRHRLLNAAMARLSADDREALDAYFERDGEHLPRRTAEEASAAQKQLQRECRARKRLIKAAREIIDGGREM